MPIGIRCNKCRKPMRVVAIWIPTGAPKPIVGYACGCGGHAETDQYGKTVQAPALKLDRVASPVHQAIWLELEMFGKKA